MCAWNLAFSTTDADKKEEKKYDCTQPPPSPSHRCTHFLLTWIAFFHGFLFHAIVEMLARLIYDISNMPIHSSSFSSKRECNICSGCQSQPLSMKYPIDFFPAMYIKYSIHWTKQRKKEREKAHAEGSLYAHLQFTEKTIRHSITLVTFFSIDFFYVLSHFN